MGRFEQSSHSGWVPPISAPPVRFPLIRAIVTNLGMSAPWMGGICSGPVVYLEVSVALMHIVVACPSVVGVGIGVYLWLWVSIPEDNSERIDNETFSPGLIQLRGECVSQVSRSRTVAVGVTLIVTTITGTILDTMNTLDWQDVGSIATVGSGISLVWS